MKRIGITGQNGFIGSHLFNTLNLFKEEFSLILFDESSFQSNLKLEKWVKQCDVIVHLAAQNRHSDAQVLYDTNIGLVKKLISALEKTKHRPHIIFSSSAQEGNDSLYGKSKRIGRELLEQWGKEKNACITGMIIPNVFGPFARPFYNSVVATFCYQLCNNQPPVIDKDGYLKLIFVQELVDEIIKAIREKKNLPSMIVSYTSEHYVSDILSKFIAFKNLYFDQGIIPPIPDKFSFNLFNTFRSYIDHASYFPYKLNAHSDNRGSFVEFIKLDQGGQFSFSTTYPGVTRGNHFHTRKIERFVVIKGKALIQLRKFNTHEIINFELNGNEPSYVDMPIWYTHNIKNIGEEELYTVFWINEFYDPADHDTYFQTV